MSRWTVACEGLFFCPGQEGNEMQRFHMDTDVMKRLLKCQKPLFDTREIKYESLNLQTVKTERRLSRRKLVFLHVPSENI